MNAVNIRKVVFLLSVFYALAAAQIIAQKNISISGEVLNSETGNPLQYVNIKVLNTNRGTTTNSSGQFTIMLPAGNYDFKFSYVGFKSRTIEIGNSAGDLIIKLDPAPVEFGPVEIIPGLEGYSWAELFVLDAIKNKNSFLGDLDHYSAFAYSKTNISTADSSETLIAFIEAVAELNFIPPSYYSEKILDLKLPRLLENIPYENIGIKLNTDLNRDEIILQKFSAVSPLSDDALDYYKYAVKDETLIDSDTLVVIEVTPKYEFRPLFTGELVFNWDSHDLVEARLDGNNAMSDGFVGRFSLYQRYDLKGEFNVPVFSKIRLRMNLSGMRAWITQENTIIDYNFNANADESAAVLDKKILFEPDIRYAVDSTRNSLFNVPLTQNEINARREIDSLYTSSPFLFRAFLCFITDVVPLVFDKPASFGGVSILKTSDWYHFDKVSGHYLGGEYQFFNGNNFNLYAGAGYAFGAKEYEYDLRFRWKNIIASASSGIKNLGNFAYNRFYNSLNSLFTHEDLFNYYKSRAFSLAFTRNFGTKWNFSAGLNFETQNPAINNSEFSIFRNDREYTPNFVVPENRNNCIDLRLDYIENNNYSSENLVVYKGWSFLNVSLNFTRYGKFLNSDENRSVFNLSLKGTHTIYGPAWIYLFAGLHLQEKTNFIQNMNYLNRYELLMVEESPLTFYTTDNYKYFAENFFRVKSDINLYNLPGGSSFGLVVSYLHSFGEKSKIDGGDMIRVKNNFVEYGLFVKGLTYINFYVMVNNMDVKKPLFFFTFYL